ncbi:MAG: hypothetical protein GY796_19870 [Chloroflexi bacterium]|nr:hypothetical protein [Chloroflexota bacterium]
MNVDNISTKRLSIAAVKNSAGIQIVILCVFILLFYYGLWDAFFAGKDDFTWAGLMRHRDSILAALSGLNANVRFLNWGLIWLKARFFYLNASAYFWLSLLQHAAVTITVYWLVNFWAQRRRLAFLSALLFATLFSHYEVITSTSASGYSWWTLVYLLGLGAFGLYLQRRKLGWYLLTVAIYLALALGFPFAMTLPLLFMAYHLTLGKGEKRVRDFRWPEIKLYLPIGLIWVGQIALNLSYMAAGTSKAVYSESLYKPGLHMVTNLVYVVFHLVPNVHVAPIGNFLTGFVGENGVELIWQGSLVAGAAAVVGSLILLWKGSVLVRFGVALVYLPYLPYTLWQNEYASAPRYFYLPSVGFALLLALFLLGVHDYLRRKQFVGWRLVVPTTVLLLLLSNFLSTQVWVQRHVANGRFRRPIVLQLAEEYQTLVSGSHLFIEVPEEKFTDLEAACVLVLEPDVHCTAVISANFSFAELTADISDEPVYWLRATADGLQQIYP